MTNQPFPQPFPENSHEVRESLRAGRDAEAVNRVMESYHGPLLGCLRRSRFARMFNGSTVDTDEDVVQNFMTSRVAREDFLREWTSRPARLRYYLLGAFMNFLRWQQRKVESQRSGPFVDDDAVADPCPDVSREFDRDVARTIAQHAWRSAQEHALRKGMGAEFDAFRRKYLDNRTHRQIQEELSGAKGNVSRFVEKIEGWIAAEIRARVGRPGANSDEIDQAIRELMEALR